VGAIAAGELAHPLEALLAAFGDRVGGAELAAEVGAVGVAKRAFNRLGEVWGVWIAVTVFDSLTSTFFGWLQTPGERAGAQRLESAYLPSVTSVRGVRALGWRGGGGFR
jgi:hypothetical protein